MPYTDGVVTFMAGGALEAHRRVKVDTGGSQAPIDVIYADAGEAAIGVTEHAAANETPVAVKLFTWGGTMEIEAADTWAVGATIYGAADGKASDSATGSAIGVGKTLCATAAEIIEIIVSPVLSSTAGTISYAVFCLKKKKETVEGALGEIYTDLLSAQSFIGIPINVWREATNFDVGAIAANGGILASDTTPILEAINAATDGCQRISWANANNDQIVTSIPLPPDIDTSKALILHTRIASISTNDAVGFTVDTFFNEGDTKVVDTSATNQTATFGEKLTTIAAADIPTTAQTMTIGLTPVAHTTDYMYLTATWLEYTRKLRTT